MATMSDVAKEAKVSTATVSHVINKTRFVKKETCERVIKAMEKLNYRPNFAARSLRKQQTKIIGLLLPDVSNLFYMSIVEGIDSVLSQKGYNLIVSNSNNLISNEKKKLEVFNAQLIDGLIIRPSYGDYGFLRKYSTSFPIIFIDCKPNNFNGENCILTDNIEGAYEATELLIKKGHQKIGLINGIMGETTSDERFLGYKKALEDNRISLDMKIIKNGDYRMKSGYVLARELLTETDISSLFITNNAMTMGALNYIKETKIKVPSQLSIIGFDDREWAQLVTPSLTVVKQFPFEIGEKAANTLLNRINKKNSRNKDGEKIKREEYRLPTQLVLRDSC